MHVGALTLTGAVLLTASTENGIHSRVLLGEIGISQQPVRSEIAWLTARVTSAPSLKPTSTVLDAKKCAELGMGMFLAVGQGSDQEPKFVHMTYKPAKKPKKKIAFIGKGVTFDSGGYSLKPSNAMEDMKVDMSGAAAVIAAMDAIATLGSGGSGGREGPTMLIGGALGSSVGRLLGVTPRAPTT